MNSLYQIETKSQHNHEDFSMKTWSEMLRRLPVIRHIRALRAWNALDDWYYTWESFGYYRQAGWDEPARAIWRGDA